MVINYKDIKFLLWRDIRQPDITGKVGREEIAKLNNAPNGSFSVMEQDNRINFELIYQLIVDIQNRDLEIPLETALILINAHFSDYWLIERLL